MIHGHVWTCYKRSKSTNQEDVAFTVHPSPLPAVHPGLGIQTKMKRFLVIYLISWESKVPPHKATPPINKNLLRDY